MAKEPTVKTQQVGGIWFRLMHFHEPGEHHKGHIHTFDHCTLLSRGRVRVTVEGESSAYEAPYLIVIGKGKRHDLTALDADTIVTCIAREDAVVTP